MSVIGECVEALGWKNGKALVREEYEWQFLARKTEKEVEKYGLGFNEKQVGEAVNGLVKTSTTQFYNRVTNLATVYARADADADSLHQCYEDGEVEKTVFKYDDRTILMKIGDRVHLTGMLIGGLGVATGASGAQLMRQAYMKRWIPLKNMKEKLLEMCELFESDAHNLGVGLKAKMESFLAKLNWPATEAPEVRKSVKRTIDRTMWTLECLADKNVVDDFDDILDEAVVELKDRVDRIKAKRSRND